MANSWMSILAFAIFNVFLFLLVVGNSDFCGSVFETQVGNISMPITLVCLNFDPRKKIIDSSRKRIHGSR